MLHLRCLPPPRVPCGAPAGPPPVPAPPQRVSGGPAGRKGGGRVGWCLYNFFLPSPHPISTSFFRVPRTFFSFHLTTSKKGQEDVLFPSFKVFLLTPYSRVHRNPPPLSWVCGFVCVVSTIPTGPVPDDAPLHAAEPEPVRGRECVPVSAGHVGRPGLGPQHLHPPPGVRLGRRGETGHDREDWSCGRAEGRSTLIVAGKIRARRYGDLWKPLGSHCQTQSPTFPRVRSF